MKLSALRPALLAAAALIAATVSAQTLKPNQTLGFGDNKQLVFTYTQNFDCIDQPNDDLNFNGIIAANDPAEMQTPICQAGTNPSINPPDRSATRTKRPNRCLFWCRCFPSTTTRIPMMRFPATMWCREPYVGPRWAPN